MKITKLGRYVLTDDCITDIHLETPNIIPANEIVTITKIDEAAQRVYVEEFGKWVNWYLPVYEYNSNTTNDKHIIGYN